MTRSRLRRYAARTFVAACAACSALVLLVTWFQVGAHDYPGAAWSALGLLVTMLLVAVAVLLLLASFVVRRD